MLLDPFLQLRHLVADRRHRHVERDTRIAARLARPQPWQAVPKEVDVDLHHVERFRPLLQVADELDIGTRHQVDLIAKALQSLLSVSAELGLKLVRAVAYMYLHFTWIVRRSIADRQCRPTCGPRDRQAGQVVAADQNGARGAFRPGLTNRIVLACWPATVVETKDQERLK